MALFVADPPSANSITDTNNLLGFGDYMANLFLAVPGKVRGCSKNCIDNLRNFISRQNPAIWDASLYIAETFEQIMKVVKALKFVLSYN